MFPQQLNKLPKSFVTEPAVFPGPIPLCSDAFTHLPSGKPQSPSSYKKTQPSLPETITADNTLQATQRFTSIQPVHESNGILQYKFYPRSVWVGELFVLKLDKLLLLRGKIREDTTKKW